MDNKVKNPATEGKCFQQQPACDPAIQTCIQTEIEVQAPPPPPTTETGDKTQNSDYQAKSTPETIVAEPKPVFQAPSIFKTEIRRCKETAGGNVLCQTIDIHPLATKEDPSSSTSKLPKEMKTLVREHAALVRLHKKKANLTPEQTAEIRSRAMSYAKRYYQNQYQIYKTYVGEKTVYQNGKPIPRKADIALKKMESAKRTYQQFKGASEISDKMWKTVITMTKDDVRHSLHSYVSENMLMGESNANLRGELLTQINALTKIEDPKIFAYQIELLHAKVTQIKIIELLIKTSGNEAVISGREINLKSEMARLIGIQDLATFKTEAGKMISDTIPKVALANYLDEGMKLADRHVAASLKTRGEADRKLVGRLSAGCGGERSACRSSAAKGAELVATHETKNRLHSGFSKIRDGYLKARRLLNAGKADEAYAIFKEINESKETARLTKDLTKGLKLAEVDQFAGKVGIIVAAAAIASLVTAGVATPALLALGFEAGTASFAAATLLTESAIFLGVEKAANWAIYDEPVWDSSKSVTNNILTTGKEVVMTALMFKFFRLGGDVVSKLGKGSLKNLAKAWDHGTRVEKACAGAGYALMELAKLGGKYETFTLWDRMNHLTDQVLNPLLGQDVPEFQSHSDRLKFFAALEIGGLIAAPLVAPLRKSINSRLKESLNEKLRINGEKVAEYQAKMRGLMATRGTVDSVRLNKLLRQGRRLTRQQGKLLGSLGNMKGVDVSPARQELARKAENHAQFYQDMATGKYNGKTPEATRRALESAKNDGLITDFTEASVDGVGQVFNVTIDSDLGPKRSVIRPKAEKTKPPSMRESLELLGQVGMVAGVGLPGTGGGRRNRRPFRDIPIERGEESTMREWADLTLEEKMIPRFILAKDVNLVEAKRQLSGVNDVAAIHPSSPKTFYEKTNGQVTKNDIDIHTTTQKTTIELKSRGMDFPLLIKETQTERPVEVTLPEKISEVSGKRLMDFRDVASGKNCPVTIKGADGRVLKIVRNPKTGETTILEGTPNNVNKQKLDPNRVVQYKPHPEYGISIRGHSELAKNVMAERNARYIVNIDPTQNLETWRTIFGDAVTYANEVSHEGRSDYHSYGKSRQWEKGWDRVLRGAKSLVDLKKGPELAKVADIIKTQSGSKLAGRDNSMYFARILGETSNKMSAIDHVVRLFKSKNGVHVTGAGVEKVFKQHIDVPRDRSTEAARIRQSEAQSARGAAIAEVNAALAFKEVMILGDEIYMIPTAPGADGKTPDFALIRGSKLLYLDVKRSFAGLQLVDQIERGVNQLRGSPSRTVSQYTDIDNNRTIAARYVWVDVPPNDRGNYPVPTVNLTRGGRNRVAHYGPLDVDVLLLFDNRVETLTLPKIPTTRTVPSLIAAEQVVVHL